MIDRVWPGPAARASLKAGDQIIKINGKDLNGLSRDQILLLMKGKEGTEVTLTILSPGSVSTRDVSLTRERASLLDKEAEDEFARQTKSFEGTFGIFGNTGTWRRAGKLVIYPSDTTKIRFNLDEFDGKRGTNCPALLLTRRDLMVCSFVKLIGMTRIGTMERQDSKRHLPPGGHRIRSHSSAL